MAILLGERAHLIEFPSVLLPPGAALGSIVNISVSRNVAEEKKRDAEFWALQHNLLQTYGVKVPQAPRLQIRNVTQTSVTLEWPKLDLATAKLRSLDLYRDHQRVLAIPSPLTNTSTKISGLSINTEYKFHLVLRTTAGTYQSNILQVRTHTMADTSGISVCFGNVQDGELLERAKAALAEMGAKWGDKIQIDTTHFVCTTPAATPYGAQATGSISTAPGVEYQKALQMSIPVVHPNWVLACHSEKKMVAIHPYYLGASSSSPMASAPFTRPQSMSGVTLPSPSSRSSPTAQQQQNKAANRQSMPPPRTSSISPTASAFVGQNQSRSEVIKPIEPTLPEEDSEEEDGAVSEQRQKSLDPHLQTHAEDGSTTDEDEAERKGRTRKGTMKRDFKFPSPTTTAPPPVPPVPTATPLVPPGSSGSDHNTPAQHEGPEPTARPTGSTHKQNTESTEEATLSVPESAQTSNVPNVDIITPSAVEVPPPPPVDKERSPALASNFGDEDVGETEEISLS
ncbi:hypothetical protein K474DRAFT_1668511 [Panus rudis PR-1116 ss-1]|nr:hypothetical protein K474DRAFT_1668511 [Panus rudis PR-1116 ss-1]